MSAFATTTSQYETRKRDVSVAAKSGEILIGGDLSVLRLGYGAMRLTGPGVWGEPRDRKECIAVLQRAVELGINFIDTADSYGPFVSEELIAEALHPYPAELVIATKAGLQRPGPDEWVPDGRPEHLRERCEGSLKRLRLECIDLFQLHRIDRTVLFEDQIGVLVDLQKEGKIRHIGLSEVGSKELAAARALTPIASVQNRYNLVDRTSESVLGDCARLGIAFIPWYPLAAGGMAGPESPMAKIAEDLEITAGQLALAWLLKKSAVTLPIPGTSSISHLEENTAAASVQISDDIMREIEALVIPG